MSMEDHLPGLKSDKTGENQASVVVHLPLPRPLRAPAPRAPRPTAQPARAHPARALSLCHWHGSWVLAQAIAEMMKVQEVGKNRASAPR